MTGPRGEAAGFDAGEAREAWDAFADAYARAQDVGRDHYRVAFFGPAHAALCGDVAGSRLLDVGCGSGWFSREMARRGARVLGVDLSPRMIDRARAEEAASPLGVEYRVADAVALAETFAPASFDVATSCMALQDVWAPHRALRAVHAVLRPGGRLVASITHPCTDTPVREWQREPDGRKRRLCVDRYFDRTTLRYAWQGWGHERTTPAVHATLEDWFGWALDAGFRVRAVREPRPTAEALRAHPDLDDASRVPYYLLLDLARDG